MNVNNNLVGILNVRGVDYISLTDLARYKNPDNPGDVIIKWMSNKSSFVVPRLTDKQKIFAYASEADIINVALFRMTAKEWRECNPGKDGNIRDSANVV